MEHFLNSLPESVFLIVGTGVIFIALTILVVAISTYVSCKIRKNLYPNGERRENVLLLGDIITKAMNARQCNLHGEIDNATKKLEGQIEDITEFRKFLCAHARWTGKGMIKIANRLGISDIDPEPSEFEVIDKIL